MKLDVTSKKEEPLMSRTFVGGSLEFENITPSNSDVTGLIAKQLKADKNLVSVRHIYNSFGQKKASVAAYVYSSADTMKLYEPRKGRKAIEKESKLAEAEKKKAEDVKTAAEAKKEEAPKAEEKPAEEAKETKAEKKPKAKSESPKEEKKEAKEEKKEAKESKPAEKAPEEKK